MLDAAIIEYNNKNLEGLNVVICGDIEKSWIVKGNSMLSLSSNTSFKGMPMQGKVLSCWKDGIEIYQCN